MRVSRLPPEARSAATSPAKYAASAGFVRRAPTGASGRYSAAEEGHSARKRGSRKASTPRRKRSSGAPRSARPRAGSSTSSRRRVPKRASRMHQASSAAGTVAASRPSPGMRSSPSDAKCASVARAGAVPWPEIANARCSRADQNRIGTSPAGPFMWGSRTCSAKPIAQAASAALPPRASVAAPACVARWWPAATAPPKPSSRAIGLTPSRWAARSRRRASAAGSSATARGAAG